MAKARAKSSELIEALRRKKPEAGFFRFEADNFNADEMEHLLAAQGLFESNYIVLLDNVFEVRENQEVIKKNAEQIKNSPHMFVLLDAGIDKKTIKELEKIADKTQYFKGVASSAKKEENDFSIFKLADALGERDNKKLWIFYQRALEHNVSIEEMFGILFWQNKSILLASSANTPEEVGMNPFPFKKAKNFSRNFTTEELLSISSALMHRYHQSREEGNEPEIELEKFILGD